MFKMKIGMPLGTIDFVKSKATISFSTSKLFELISNNLCLFCYSIVPGTKGIFCSILEPNVEN